MELASLLATLTAEGFTMGAVGCNAIEVKGPTQRLTPALRQALAEHKPTLLAMLTPQGDAYAGEERQAIQREGEADAEAVAFPFGVNDDDGWWDCLTEADRRELTAQREPRSPCCWCGGRNHHHPQCFGQPTMPWGKHKGQPLATVPRGYLAFVHRQGIGREETRQSFLAELRRRYTE